jgi:hypothetical protein
MTGEAGISSLTGSAGSGVAVTVIVTVGTGAGVDGAETPGSDVVPVHPASSATAVTVVNSVIGAVFIGASYEAILWDRPTRSHYVTGNDLGGALLVRLAAFVLCLRVVGGLEYM